MLSFNMATMLSLLVLSLATAITFAKPEQGIWTINMDAKHSISSFMKSMYKGSQISVSVLCESKEDAQFTMRWILRRSPCAQEYNTVSSSVQQQHYYLDSPKQKSLVKMPYKKTEYLTSSFVIKCFNKRHFYIFPFNYTTPTVVVFSDTNVNSTTPKQAVKATEKTVVKATEKVKPAADAATTKKPSASGRKRRDTEGKTPAPKKKDKQTLSDSKKVDNKVDKPAHKPPDIDSQDMLTVWDDGYYLFVIALEDPSPTVELSSDLKLELTVRMYRGNSFIAAVDYPLLIFYGVMGLVYISLGLFWLVMLACTWRDLLRIQFWVGGVILLGMLEKAVFFAEYENINKSGMSVKGAIVMAELVSCVKRSLARMLVIIVSLGFGIVKPRLGQTLHKVLVVGFVYFVLASIEGCMRAVSSKSDQSKDNMVAAVPLAVTDAIICWWIFSSLLQTTRTLRLRRNVVKLSLYRHFTNTLIFAVIASIGYMIWFMTQHRFKDCITDWKELWVDEAFWHLLFSVILFIIMILWRPTTNNQRYAFSPLLDAAEDDLDDEQVLTEAYEGMKMRSTSTKTQQRNGSPKLLDNDRKMEDDLKWVEENIPSSLADKVLPALDSDEEIMNTRFEVSKME